MDPNLPGIDITQSQGNFSCITTHAVGLGEGKASERNFVGQITACLQNFLHTGAGSFELISSLQTIHTSIAMTTVPPMLQTLILNGKVP